MLDIGLDKYTLNEFAKKTKVKFSQQVSSVDGHSNSFSTA